MISEWIDSVRLIAAIRINGSLEETLFERNWTFIFFSIHRVTGKILTLRILNKRLDNQENVITSYICNNKM